MSPSYTDALMELSAKIDDLSDCVQRQEEVLDAIHQINGNVRDHGKVLAAQKQWVISHAELHAKQDKDFRALSGWVWKLGGGSGLLAVVATALQILNL